ncbi:hypothetical protein BJV82DRAFT_580062 [Fennellomyces sp. T-0311]|nr:hypothetical protein BJV82DRAFT_580062 [Fennellomyces sp. T-0311]
MEDTPGNISDDIDPTASRSNSPIPNLDPDPDPTWEDPSLDPSYVRFLQMTREQHGTSPVGGFSETSGLIHSHNQDQLLDPTFSENSRSFPEQQSDYPTSHRNYERQEQMAINQLAPRNMVNPYDELIQTSRPTEPTEGDGDLTHEILRFLHGDPIPAAIMERYGLISSDSSDRVRDVGQQVDRIPFLQTNQSSGIRPQGNSNIWITPPEHHGYQGTLIMYRYCSSCERAFSEMDFNNLHRNHEQ